ncbi:MAG: HAMP domain-containing sensor histidine kinase [Immundisolibacterales bacterium]|nr:HAMP domain-containing sensor histidine kinase [Immundisolibacterales bacterium]
MTKTKERRLGHLDLLRMQGTLKGHYNRAIWSPKSSSGRMNVLRVAMPLVAIAAAVEQSRDGLSVLAIVLWLFVLTSLAHLVIANMIAMRLIMVAEWILRLTAGDLEYRLKLAGNDQTTWMCEAMEKVRRRSVEVVNLPRARELAAELEQRNTDLNHTLEHLKRSQDQLVAQQKSNEVGRLTAGIAHEIRNPLNLAQNFADGTAELVNELVEELDDESPAARRYAKLSETFRQIARHSRQANQTIERVLELGAGHAKSRELDIAEIAMRHARIAIEGHRLGNGLEIELARDTGDARHPLHAQAQGIARLATNLVTNACQAIAERAGNASERRYGAVVTVRVRTTPEHATLEVNDNGAGMDEKTLERAAEPFFTTRSLQNAAGLGLSECTDIVRMHQGTMRIESTNGEGTTVRVEIPNRARPGDRTKGLRPAFVSDEAVPK